MEGCLLSRCRAEEVAAQLRLVARGLPFLADRPWDAVGWGLMRIELLSLWRLELLLEPGGRAAGGRATGDGAAITMRGWSDSSLSLITWAGAPDGRCWAYGCQRDDWTLGPGSRLVEPLQFLSGAERLALEQLLRRARCWPAPRGGNPLGPVVALPEQRLRPRRRRRRPIHCHRGASS